MKFQVIFVVLIVTLFDITTEAHIRKHYRSHKRKHGLSHLPCEMRNCTDKGKFCVEFHPLCLHKNTAVTKSKCVKTPPKGCKECICVREDGEFSCRKDISELQIPVCILPSPKPQHNKKSHKKCHCRYDVDVDIVVIIDDDDDDAKTNNDYDSDDDDDDDSNDKTSNDDYDRYDGDLGSGDDTMNGKKIKSTRFKGRKPCHKRRHRVRPRPTPRLHIPTLVIGTD